MVRDEKSRKSHRDRSLSKLVAMNRRLESQVSMVRVSQIFNIHFFIPLKLAEVARSNSQTRHTFTCKTEKNQ